MNSMFLSMAISPIIILWFLVFFHTKWEQKIKVLQRCRGFGNGNWDFGNVHRWFLVWAQGTTQVKQSHQSLHQLQGKKSFKLHLHSLNHDTYGPNLLITNLTPSKKTHESVTGWGPGQQNREPLISESDREACKNLLSDLSLKVHPFLFFHVILILQSLLVNASHPHPNAAWQVRLNHWVRQVVRSKPGLVGLLLR